MAKDVTDDTEYYENDPHYQIVGLLGQVPAKVTVKPGENIYITDPVGASNLVGYGEKMTKQGTVVGFATESTEHWNENTCPLISNISNIPVSYTHLDVYKRQVQLVLG